MRPRLIDAIIITPARRLARRVFVGTTFELFFHKGLERIRMARLQQRLDGHNVVPALEAQGARERGAG